MLPPLEPPQDLAVPAAGSATARVIASRALGRLLSEVRVIVRAQRATAGVADALAVERALEAVVKKDAGVLASILRRPHASTLARVLRSGDAERSRSVAIEFLAVLAFDLASVGALPFELVLRRLPRRIVSLVSRTCVECPDDATAATFANGVVIFERAAGLQTTVHLRSVAHDDAHGPLTFPYRVVENDIVLALVDNNPLADIEAHPEKRNANRIDLGDRRAEGWVNALRQALGIVSTGLPPMRADIDVLLQQIVPTGFDSERHLSCSYQENLGTIYMSLHDRPMTMVEALIHEVSHNKLNALFELDPIIQNPPDELHASPVRPDPRPLRGVLLAVHAFLPVARLYERMIEMRASLAEDPNFRQRFEAIVLGNREGTAVLLAHGRPTDLGRGLWDEIARWDAHFR
jgi:HEXXH motif-containing protein